MHKKLELFVELLVVVASLKSVDGENPEYDRALVEMIENVSGLGLNEDDRDTINKILAAISDERN